MKKTNIAELLKDCPKGMELYSPIFGEVYLDKIRPHLAIVVATDKEQGDSKEEFLYDGRYGMNGECMLFPSKGKTTWEGFQRPFEDGVIVATHSGRQVFILQKTKEDNVGYCYIGYDFGDKDVLAAGEWAFDRLATEEEKAKLFQVIKDNGYKWNAKTKTLEKLVEPKFKVGDIIKDVDGYKVEIFKVDIDEECYEYISIIAKGIGSIPFKVQDEWELAPNKFDITTLKPFDKVLVRDGAGLWRPSLFGKDMIVGYRYFTSNGSYKECIPYEGNEHLLGKTDDCDEFYKTWK